MPEKNWSILIAYKAFKASDTCHILVG